ncbi:MAG TPA: hypothetical protein QF813_09725 [Alphaproteobacteria bacterium]|nr:hypothetical protein [Alphaproteobacteria bacterium]
MLVEGIADDADRTAPGSLVVDRCALAFGPVLRLRLSGRTVAELGPFTAIEGLDGKAAPAIQDEI